MQEIHRYYQATKREALNAGWEEAFLIKVAEKHYLKICQAQRIPNKKLRESLLKFMEAARKLRAAEYRLLHQFTIKDKGYDP